MVSEKAKQGATGFTHAASNELLPNNVMNSSLIVSKEDYVGKPALPPQPGVINSVLQHQVSVEVQWRM